MRKLITGLVSILVLAMPGKMRVSEMLLVIAALFLSLADVNSQYEPVCNPADYSPSPDPPLPSLPDQFSTTIEANLIQWNQSFLATEYYDDPGNRGRIEFVDSDSGQKIMAIFDYDLGEVFLIPDRVRNASCGVQLLGEGPPPALVNETFGIIRINGSVHIGSVSNLFDLGADQPTRYYDEVEMVRGIPCNHWQTCHVLDNNSYTLDYYFASTDDWTYVYEGDTAVLVQIILTGTRVGDDGDLRTLNHIYSFVDFYSGPDAVPDSAFAVPTGLPCLGRISGKELPQVGSFYSAYVETIGLGDSFRTIRVGIYMYLKATINCGY